MNKTLGKIVCDVLSRHKWDQPLKEDAFFQRINCTRCGLAIDGARVQVLREKLPQDHWILKRFPQPKPKEQ